jgi:hypothetical protein
VKSLQNFSVETVKTSKELEKLGFKRSIILKWILKILRGKEEECSPDFFCDEGPRSKRYGRTTALRLFVQPL